jgi:hypothetical protein
LVAWAAVAPAMSYTVYQSTTSATTGFTVAASNVTTLSYTQSGLGFGNYWFEVEGSVGTHWIGPTSGATVKRTIALLFCG